MAFPNKEVLKDRVRMQQKGNMFHQRAILRDSEERLKKKGGRQASSVGGSEGGSLNLMDNEQHIVRNAVQTY